MRNWLTQLWRLRCPTLWKLEAQESWCYTSSPNLETWEPGALMSKGRRKRRPQLNKRGKVSPPLPFCSICALNGLDDAHLPWWGNLLYSLYWFKCLCFPMLMSSRNTPTDIPRKNILSAIWASRWHIILTITNLHNCQESMANKIVFEVWEVLRFSPKKALSWVTQTKCRHRHKYIVN